MPSNISTVRGKLFYVNFWCPVSLDHRYLHYAATNHWSRQGLDFRILMHGWSVMSDLLQPHSQAPLSLGFPRQKYCSGLPHLPPEALPYPGMESKFSCVSCIGRRVFTLALWEAHFRVLREAFFTFQPQRVDKVSYCLLLWVDTFVRWMIFLKDAHVLFFAFVAVLECNCFTILC